MSVELLVRSAGAIQLLQTVAIFAGNRGLGWGQELKSMTPLGRSFVYSIASGIYVYVTGGGILTFIYAREIASSSLGAALCALQAFAWAVRVGFQLFGMHPVWDTRARWLHYAMCCVYSTVTVIYTWVSCAWFS